MACATPPSPPKQRLSAVPAPPPPTDLTPAALFLPLHKVSARHVGRKLRLVVQIMALDQNHKATHLLVTARAEYPRPLLLVRVDSVLLGNQAQPPVWFDGPVTTTHIPPGARRVRAPLSLRPGEWITVVGWLEEPTTALKISVPGGYAQPLDAVLECIHLSMAREPGGMTRGEAE